MRYFFLLFLIRHVFLFANTDYSLKSTLWQSTSAEYKALCYQTYNIAKIELDKILKIKTNKKQAIVLDVDDTVLSHTFFDAYLIKNKKKFTEELWGKWLAALKAPAVSGSLEFVRYAYKRGVQIFYVTNMKEHLAKYGIKRLKQLGFPNASKKFYFARKKKKNKQGRRNKILAKGYNIIMYIGDQLTDMPGFKAKTVNARYQELEKTKQYFGTKYFLLPNVIYGTWQKALGHKLSRDSIKDTWKP